MQRINRWYRKITPFDARSVTQVAVSIDLFRVPAGFRGIDLVGRFSHLIGPADIVENEEFIFRTEKCGVADTGRLHIGLGAFGDRAWVALIALHVFRLDDVATQNQRIIVEERVHFCGSWVRHQDHVRFVDTFPTSNGRTVEHFAFFESIFVDGMSRKSDMLLFTAGVAKTKINEFDIVFLDHF